MKKIYLAYIAAFLIVACDPIEDRDELSGNVAVEDLDLSVDPIVENGLTTNSFIVENNSPILSRWITDREQIQNSYCTISCNTAGDQEVKFVGLNGDGTFLEQLFPVFVDTMVNLPANVKARLGIKYTDDGSVDKTVPVAKEVGARQAIAVVHQPDFAPLVRKLGIDHAVTPRASIANRVLRVVHQKNVSTLAVLEEGDVEIIELTVDGNSSIHGRALKDVRLPRGALVATILRGEKVIVPKGDAVIQSGDSIVLIASAELLDAVQKLFKK